LHLGLGRSRDGRHRGRFGRGHRFDGSDPGRRGVCTLLATQAASQQIALAKQALHAGGRRDGDVFPLDLNLLRLPGVIRRQRRLGLSFASLWGVLSFSMCGLSFPAMAMHPVLQGLANLFPLRHYFLIYADQALNGYPMIYSWMNYVALLVFMMLPFLVARRLKEALIHYKYLP
jgi:hypothetical protein